MIRCILCSAELVKLSEDTIYCPNSACQNYGVDVALGKSDDDVVIEIRTGEPK